MSTHRALTADTDGCDAWFDMPQPQGSTWVFAKVDGKLSRWLVGTPDAERAVAWVRSELPVRIRPVLALIERPLFLAHRTNGGSHDRA